MTLLFAFPVKFLLWIGKALSSKDYLKLSLVPLIVGFISFFLLGSTSILVVNDLSSSLIESSSWLANTLVSLLIGFSGIILSGIMSFVMVIALSSFFLELACEKVLRDSGVELQSPEGKIQFLVTILKSLGAGMVRALLFGLAAVLPPILSFIPPLALLGALLSLVLVGANIVDVAASVVPLPLSKRILLPFSHFWLSFSVGLTAAVVFLVPFFSFLFLVPLHCAAAELFGDPTRRATGIASS